MAKTDDEQYLTSKGWEHVMTEEEGCDTWHLPWNLRTKWPDNMAGKTQFYWDTKEALAFQQQLEQAGYDHGQS